MSNLKILVAIPCLYGHDHCKEAIESVVYKKDVGALLIDNGATSDISKLLCGYFHPGLQDVSILRNEENLYVTGAWQQAIDYFLAHQSYSHLILMNSDLIMHDQWAKVLLNRWDKDPDEIILPIMNQRRIEPVNIDIDQADIVTSGTPGVFITLNRKQAELINPLPKEVRVWFSDNWIFEICRAMGYNTIIPKNLFAYHYWSQTVEKVPNITQIIEEDKLAWESIVKPKMIDFIEKNRGTYIKYQENI